MNIDVIIPFFNGDDCISACVTSILTGQTDVHRIYLIDNSNKPTQVADFFKFDPQVVLIHAKPAIGFARACNIGLFHSKSNGGEMAVILNQDARLHPYCLQYLQEPLLADERIFAVVPVSMDYEMTDITSKTLQKYILPFEDYLRDLIAGRPIRFYSVKHPMHANAACVALRISMLDEIGFFDPIFPMYGEDTELFARALYRYHRLIAFAPQARIGHAHSNFSAKGPEAKRMNMLTRAALQLFFIKNPGAHPMTSLWKCFTYSCHTYLRALAKGHTDRIAAYLYSDLKMLGTLPAIMRSRTHQSLKKRIEFFLKKDVL
jgi:GT2 family glycosyltransferase